MFDETGPDFSAQPCAAHVADLSPEALADFRSRWARKAGNPRIAQQTDAQTLADAELMIDGELTHAALILFGTRSALGRHLAQAEIVFEYRSSEASGPAQDRTGVPRGVLSGSRPTVGEDQPTQTIARVIRTVCSDTTSSPSTKR